MSIRLTAAKPEWLDGSASDARASEVGEDLVRGGLIELARVDPINTAASLCSISHTWPPTSLAANRRG